MSQPSFGLSLQELGSQQQALCKVLVQLSHLGHLEINGEIDAAVLSKLRNLQSLVLGFKCQFTTFDWIQPLQHLRSLTIQETSRDCDPSDIGSLVGLVDWTSRGREWKCVDERQLEFLENRVNMKTLELNVQNLLDLSTLRGKRHLKTLRVVGSPNIDVSKKNAHILASISLNSGR